MKLFGSKKNSSHTHETAKGRKLILFLVIAIAAVGIFLVGIKGAKALINKYRTTPPPVTNSAGDNNFDFDNVDYEPPVTEPEPEPVPDPELASEPVTEPEPEPEPEPTELAPMNLDSFREGVYTFAILGRDKVSGSTDTIMVATFDTVNCKMNVVSIPRDTLVNVSWTTKKANTLYSSGGKDHEKCVSSLKTGLKELCGFEIGYYVIIDVEAFVKLVDSVGGITFDVPQDMNYDDPAQDLHIHLKKGEQLLNGTDAMGLVRFRKGYSSGDIRRIEVQQEFMSAAFEQILSKLSEQQLLTLADIFINDVQTDLDLPSIVYFANKAKSMTKDDFTFQTVPGNYYDRFTVNGREVSYVTIYVDQWLQMINEYLNPTAEEITRKNVSIAYKSGGNVYVTSGTKRISSSWGK